MRDTIPGALLVPREVLLEAQNLALVRATWAEWLQAFEWSHYCTLTFRLPTSVEGARREFQWFVRGLEHRAYNRVEWASVIEISPGDLIHLHALVGQTDHLTVARVEQAWRSGITRIRRYDPRRGAARYMTKAINNRGIEIDVSRHLTARFDAEGIDSVINLINETDHPEDLA